MRHRNQSAVQSVTAAPTSRNEEISARTRRYLISMAIRSVCLVAAVVATGPLRWTLVAGAVLLPYFAVVVANAGRERGTTDRPESVLPSRTPALEPGRPAGEQHQSPGPHDAAGPDGRHTRDDAAGRG